MYRHGKKIERKRTPAVAVERIVRHTVAARVSSMESEKLYLQHLHGELGRQWRSIGERIEAIDRQIIAEKASVPNARADLPRIKDANRESGCEGDNRG